MLSLSLSLVCLFYLKTHITGLSEVRSTYVHKHCHYHHCLPTHPSHCYCSFLLFHSLLVLPLHHHHHLHSYQYFHHHCTTGVCSANTSLLTRCKTDIMMKVAPYALATPTPYFTFHHLATVRGRHFTSRPCPLSFLFHLKGNKRTFHQTL